ncbi:hypothetical protein NIES4071_01550 [Calothrix sp. NIES-4071]|nr:hypothetical protein NIES4071_01550 [Calothrix sp. NIES-4071]BAZ54501.1 hypothetical protein NIES4105_01540 [Calothrix sp. NIES-4105]
MAYSVYQLNIPEVPEAVIFVNGFVARDFSGFLWMWKNLFWIKNSTETAPGCVQVKAGICGYNEVVMVSYWNSSLDLKEFFRGESHRKMMQFTAKHPKSLCLYNETYQPSKSGKYTNEPQGMATIYTSVLNMPA